MAVPGVEFGGERHWARQHEESALPAKRTAKRRFRTFFFKTTDRLVEAKKILADNRVPKIGDAHPDEPKCKCIRRRARCLLGSPKTWEVDCEYESNELPATKISFGVEKREVVPSAAYRNRYQPVRSRAITTSAKEPYDPPQTVPQSRQTITIIAYREKFDPSHQDKFIDKLNLDAYTVSGHNLVPVTYYPGELRITDYRADEEVIGSRTVWRLTCVLLVDREHQHLLRLFDYGTYYLGTNEDPDETPHLPFYAKDGVTQIRGRLDGGGGALTDPKAADVFLEYDVFNGVNFSELGLL